MTKLVTQDLTIDKNALSNQMHLTEKEISDLILKLEEEKNRIISNITKNKHDGTVASNESKDDVDSANDDILMATKLRFNNRESFYLKKINKALMKIERSEYGSCEDCGCTINFQRLIARPTSELCIGCKEETEKAENQNIHLKASKSIGKKIDFITQIQ
jgi:DnaK suppressor protein